MSLLAVLLTALAFADAGTPRLVYSKSFPGSRPAYMEVHIDGSGAGSYQEELKDENPVTFQLSQAEWGQLFATADKLDHFSRPIESGLKVANMGKKTFRYEGPGGPHEVNFNYSTDEDAKLLGDLFEQIVETERAWIDLERTVRFDKLGVQDSILRIEVIRDQKRLVAQEQFLPLLDKVVKNESFIHLARDRAAALAESIRKRK